MLHYLHLLLQRVVSDVTAGLDVLHQAAGEGPHVEVVKGAYCLVWPAVVPVKFNLTVQGCDLYKISRYKKIWRY